MKQIKYCFLFAILIISSNSPTQAVDFVVNDIYYNITSEEDRTCEVTHRSDKYIGDIVIPQKVTHKRITYNVTSIGMSAFRDNKLVTSVIIPNSVISIDSSAFEGCTGLTEIAIPISVTEIGANAFKNTGWYNSQPDGILYLNNCCLGYKGDEPTGSIMIQDGTRVIAGDAFYNCDHLTNVEIPNSVISICSGAFCRCDGLKSVDIPNGVKIIGTYAFSNCKNLTKVNLSNSVMTIDEHAFNECIGLTSVTIPDGVKKIGRYAFANCENLTKVNIPISVTTLGWRIFWETRWFSSQSEGILYLDNCCLGYKGYKPTGSITIQDGTRLIADEAFAYCEELTNVDIPNGVTAIGPQTFYGCKNLTSINIPNSVTSIGSSAFYGCENLTSVRLSDNMTVIKNFTFSNCSSLTSITIPNNIKAIGASAFSSSALMSVDIPDGVTIVGEYAFCNCNYLSVIRIGKGVKNIGSMAFLGSSRLKEFYINIFNPIEADDMFFGYEFQAQATLYVPVGAVNLYKNSSNWNYFANIVEMDFNGVEDIKINKTDAVEIARYDIYGRQLTEPTKGINIIKMSDGTTRKEYVK